MTESTSKLEERVPPFRELPRGEQIMLAVSIAAGEIGARIEAILRTHEPILSHVRYNALRILRGSGNTGLSCTEIGERLLLAPPDVTRLIDPLVGRGLVSRTPDPSDRRVILQRLTPAGSALLSDLDEPLGAVYRAIAEGLEPASADELLVGCERLIGLAQRLRDARELRTHAGAAP